MIFWKSALLLFSSKCVMLGRDGLPCSHLLKLRSYLSLPLYDSSLANNRWTKSSSDALLLEYNMPAECQNTAINGTEETNLQILSQSQKFNKLTRTCQILASIGGEGGMKQFELRHKQLQKIMEHRKGGHYNWKQWENWYGRKWSWYVWHQPFSLQVEHFVLGTQSAFNLGILKNITTR